MAEAAGLNGHPDPEAAPDIEPRVARADAGETAAPQAPPVTVLWIEPGRCAELPVDTDALPARGFAWVDAHYDSPRAWLPIVERLTGTTVLEEHLSDAQNASHRSYFDSTSDYEMIVFRGLTVQAEQRAEEPIRIRTRPTVFFLFPRCLLSIRPADSRQIPLLRRRLLDAAHWAQRLPARPDELMLRILNLMVDRYLELRRPLTEQLDDWQRELLDPRRPFHDWGSLLEARRQLRRLENLSEEQLDALQEWRDERLDRSGGDEPPAEHPDRSRDAGPDGAGHEDGMLIAPLPDMLAVRVNDLVEHIERVRSHAHRLEGSVESAVQLHFSATAHRTNQVMRTLTVITAIFMPLTLITGVFGMNFEFIPGIHSASGFWWTLGAMGTIALLLVGFFRTRRYLEQTGLRGRERTRKKRRG